MIILSNHHQALSGVGIGVITTVGVVVTCSVGIAAVTGLGAGDLRRGLGRRLVGLVMERETILVGMVIESFLVPPRGIEPL